MMLNSKFKANKKSCIENKLNHYVIAYLIILAILSFTCFGASFAYDNIYNNAWYMKGREPPFYFVSFKQSKKVKNLK